MPLFVVLLVAAVIAILLVRSGIVTAGLLTSLVYGVLGGALGIMIMRLLVGPLGPLGAGIGAVIGGVVLLYFARAGSQKNDDE